MSQDVKLVGDYLIGKILGRGNFGEVYKSINLKNKKFYAVKWLYKDQIKDFSDYERVNKEI